MHFCIITLCHKFINHYWYSNFTDEETKALWSLRLKKKVPKVTSRWYSYRGWRLDSNSENKDHVLKYSLGNWWRRQRNLNPVLLPGKSHGQSLVGCSPWGHWESDTTERLHFHFSLSCIGEGNGNSLECSCLENPRDREAWWVAIYGVLQSRTRLKRLSSSSSRELKEISWSSLYSPCTLKQKKQWRSGLQAIMHCYYSRMHIWVLSVIAINAKKLMLMHTF